MFLRSAQTSILPINRVHISIRRHNKHELPMDQNCRIHHYSGIVMEGSIPCKFRDGGIPKDFIELWKCMEEVCILKFITSRERAIRQGYLCILCAGKVISQYLRYFRAYRSKAPDVNYLLHNEVFNCDRRICRNPRVTCRVMEYKFRFVCKKRRRWMEMLVHRRWRLRDTLNDETNCLVGSLGTVLFSFSSLSITLPSFNPRRDRSLGSLLFNFAVYWQLTSFCLSATPVCYTSKSLPPTAPNTSLYLIYVLCYTISSVSLSYS